MSNSFNLCSTHFFWGGNVLPGNCLLWGDAGESISKFCDIESSSRNTKHPQPWNLQGIAYGYAEVLKQGQRKQTMSRLKRINQNTSCHNWYRIYSIMSGGLYIFFIILCCLQLRSAYTFFFSLSRWHSVFPWLWFFEQTLVSHLIFFSITCTSITGGIVMNTRQS